MGREMTVSGGHMHGRNYDELIEMSGEPGHHGHHPQHHNGHPHGGHAQHGGHMVPSHEVHPSHHAPMHHEQHHGHGGHARAEHHPMHEGHHEPRAGGMRRRIVEEEPTKERLFPIGFIAEGVAPGDEVDVEVKPQVFFRGERLAIPQSIARYFDILDIKVGKDSQLAATGTMPGESFSTIAVGVRMELSTAKPGIVITLRVRNVDAAEQDFKAVMYGTVLE